MQYDNRLTVKMNLSSDFDYNVRALSTVMGGLCAGKVEGWRYRRWI